MAKNQAPLVEVGLTSSVSSGGVFRAEVDGKKLKFVNGRAEAKVTAGVQHTLSWFVLGPPGTKYEIGITRPGSAAFSHKDTLDEHGKDVGFHWFQV